VLQSLSYGQLSAHESREAPAHRMRVHDLNLSPEYQQRQSCEFEVAPSRKGKRSPSWQRNHDILSWLSKL